MSYDLGGRADKLGNRYEGRWVALQLLHMLNEEVVSVTVESIGDDERGVDLWISKKNGKNLAQQCKGRNGNKDIWSSKDFERAGIWENIKFHFERNPDNEFEFVSGASFNDLNDLCNSARNWPDDSELFYNSRIKVKGKRELLLSIFECFGFDNNNKDNRVKIFDYLRRLNFTIYPDDNNSWTSLKTLASMLVSGATESVIALLQDYAENTDNLGKPIYADELWKYLEEQEHFPQNFTHDNHILPRIKYIQDAFNANISPSLINGKLIPREEAVQCLNYITKNNSSLIILHGPAGCGKSSVLLSVVKQLERNGYIYLPVRLDRQIPNSTAEHFGEEIGLPASPVICLTKIAKDRNCVFVIDQLDAIRWTSSHSSSALDVCKELVRQVYCYQKQGKRISLIISCRTFDLNNDPEIREWIDRTSDFNWNKIEIQPLAEKTVCNVVGDRYDQITTDCKRILSNPQNLYMLLEIIKAGEQASLSLSSTTALMRRFWDTKLNRIQDILNSRGSMSIGEANSVIEELVQYMETNGKISAPRLVLSQKLQGVVKIWESQGIIYQDNSCFSFCHQTYLDYLIAQKLCREIIIGNNNILDWLGEKNKQTLFRREQLRQALVLLATDIPDLFFTAIYQILDSANVRFHIKHLILEIISTTDPTSNAKLSCFVLEKLEDPIYREIVLEVVFYRNKAWTELLISSGILNNWLSGECQNQRNDALTVLRSMAHVIPDKVAELLDTYMDQGDKWFADVLDVIGWDAAKDSDKLLKIRIKLLTNNYFPPFLDWPEIAKSNPLRAIDLVAVLLKLLPEKIDMYHRRDHFQQCHDNETEALLQTAEHCAIDTWKQLMPVIMQMTSIWPESKYDPSVERWEFKRDSSGKTLERCSVEMLIKAGRSIAEHDPVLFVDLTKNCESNPSPLVQEILIESYYVIDPTFADNAIEWLLADLNRFQLGNGKTEVVWAPAMRLLESLSPYCSQLIFDKLEDAIINYHDLDELDNAKYYLPLLKDGYSGDYWGKCQYHLLPSLAPARRKDTTNALIKVLERKFACYPKQRFLLGAEFKGGFIGSPLDKNIARLKDKTWLEIISNKLISRNDGWNWNQVDEDSVTESSIFQFSRSLRRIAVSCPERFGQLSLMFPNDVDLYYVSTIFQALACTEAKNEVFPEFKDEWMPASFSTVLKVVDHYIDLIKKDEIAIDLCRLIENRAQEPWPEYILDAVQDIAKNETKSSNIKDNNSAHQIDNATLNCPRGVACHTLASLLWDSPDLYSKVSKTVDFLSSEKDPVVLVALAHILCSIIKIDKEHAVSYFCSAANKDLRIFGGNYGLKFVNATMQEKYNFYAPFLCEMLSAQDKEIQKLGAHMISAYNLFYGCFSDYINACFNGSTANREGLAKTAAVFISDRKYADKCRGYISQLMDDPEKEVCSILSGMFNERFFDIPENIPWTVKYIRSAAFMQGSSILLYELNKRKNSLLPFADIILEVCAVVIQVKQRCEDNRHPNIGEFMYTLPQLLLRLYEQTIEDNISIAERCLDAWDLFFKYGLGNTRSLTSKMET